MLEWAVIDGSVYLSFRWREYLTRSWRSFRKSSTWWSWLHEQRRKHRMCWWHCRSVSEWTPSLQRWSDHWENWILVSRYRLYFTQLLSFTLGPLILSVGWAHYHSGYGESAKSKDTYPLQLPHFGENARGVFSSDSCNMPAIKTLPEVNQSFVTAIPFSLNDNVEHWTSSCLALKQNLSTRAPSLNLVYFTTSTLQWCNAISLF